MRFLPAVLLSPALLLAACAPTTQSRGPDYSLLSGNYQGTASLGPIPASYELLLNINGRTGRANGILTRSSNGNVYTAEGRFLPYDANGGTIDLTLASGSSDAGTLKARIQAGKLEGVMKTTLFTFQVRMQKQGVTAPTPQPALGVPLPRTSVTLETTQTQTTSVPVYVEPTPVKPARP
ncbi:hypothetical protein FNU79_10710 [Deinococcus detaillensis]|uniref:Uncharacterized protein n=1 Tax=Deinococcus detaillensis TaxID=2592048 RepID=A0A553UWW1_9DEIO|nr:hypothetical protein [Deinococcus detaillensis]TSA84695.1 hypothetical protein FNU79_10710 [Deinococcus detaillensis]